MINIRNNLLILPVYKVALERVLKTPIKNYGLNNFVREVMKQSKPKNLISNIFIQNVIIISKYRSDNFYFFTTMLA